MDIQQVNEYIDGAISKWQKRRDESFAEHGLDVQRVYADGDFDSLPPKCLINVCYVDAFKSVKLSINKVVK